MLWGEKMVVWQSNTRYWPQREETATIKGIINRINETTSLHREELRERYLIWTCKQKPLTVPHHKATEPQVARLSAEETAPEKAGLQTTSNAVCAGTPNSSGRRFSTRWLWVTVLFAKPGERSSIPGTHVKEQIDSQKGSPDFYVCPHSTHTVQVCFLLLW